MFTLIILGKGTTCTCKDYSKNKFGKLKTNIIE